MHVVSLTEALQRRAALILEVLADRTPADSDNSLSNTFRGYKASEGLEGELSIVQDKFMMTYKRPGDNSFARIRLHDPVMLNIKEVSRTEPTVMVGGIEQRKVIDVDLPPGVVVEKYAGDELEDVVSFGDAAKQAWGVAAKASLGAEIAGVTAALEVSGNYGEEYNQHHDESHTKRHSESNKLTITGPTKFKLEDYRSHNRESRTITAKCDFDHTVWIDDPSRMGIVTYNSFKNQFMAVARRIAPNIVEYYHEFIRNPLTDEQLDELDASSDKLIQFVVEYDNVITESLKRID